MAQQQSNEKGGNRSNSNAGQGNKKAGANIGNEQPMKSGSTGNKGRQEADGNKQSNAGRGNTQ